MLVMLSHFFMFASRVSVSPNPSVQSSSSSSQLMLFDGVIRGGFILNIIEANADMKSQLQEAAKNVKDVSVDRLLMFEESVRCKVALLQKIRKQQLELEELMSEKAAKHKMELELAKIQLSQIESDPDKIGNSAFERAAKYLNGPGLTEKQLPQVKEWLESVVQLVLEEITGFEHISKILEEEQSHLEATEFGQILQEIRGQRSKMENFAINIANFACEMDGVFAWRKPEEFKKLRSQIEEGLEMAELMLKKTEECRKGSQGTEERQPRILEAQKDNDLLSKSCAGSQKNE